MKTIGMLGGMSWESTQGYYQQINRGIKQKLGGLNSAQIALYSVNFQPIEECQHQGNWTETANILASAAQKVEAAGADFLLICTNTMHKVAEQINEAISIPVLHIADATAEQIKQQGLTKVGLLGTAFTMEQDFYKGRLLDKHNIEVVVPEQDDRELVHEVIYQELCLGKVVEESKQAYLRIIDKLVEQGAQAVILGCTEIGMLVHQNDTNAILLDTTKIHADKAVELALS